MIQLHQYIQHVHTNKLSPVFVFSCLFVFLLYLFSGDLLSQYHQCWLPFDKKNYLNLKLTVDFNFRWTKDGEDETRGERGAENGGWNPRLPWGNRGVEVKVTQRSTCKNSVTGVRNGQHDVMTWKHCTELLLLVWTEESPVIVDVTPFVWRHCKVAW